MIAQRYKAPGINIEADGIDGTITYVCDVIGWLDTVTGVRFLFRGRGYIHLPDS